MFTKCIPYVSWKEMSPKVLKKCHTSAVPKTIERIMKKYQMTGSVLGKNKTRKLVFFPDGAWFTLSRNINSHSNRCWCYENLHAVGEVSFTCSLQELKGVEV
jgi:hypothetical protein